MIYETNALISKTITKFVTILYYRDVQDVMGGVAITSAWKTEG